MFGEKIVEILEDAYDLDVMAYNLAPQEDIHDHDAMAVAQAGKLQEIGYLEYETEVYGCAYFKDGEVHFYLSAKDETMDKFQKQCYQNNIYPTPAKYFVKRFDLVNETEESIKHMFRLDSAYQMKEAYPPLLFEAVNALTANDCANSAFELMQELCDQLESCFDLNQLNLFEDLLDLLFNGRLLTKESYILLNQWLQKELEKIAVEPVASGDYRRTYSGFAYKTPEGTVKYFIDAFPYMAKSKQLEFIAKGYLVTPILAITYYAGSFGSLTKVKKDFKQALEHYVGPMYIKLMELFKQLPAGVDSDLYFDYLQQIRATGSKAAEEAFLYFGYLWNIKF